MFESERVCDIKLVVVPYMCAIDTSTAACGHLSGVKLTGTKVDREDLEIDLLIRSDHYWKAVTG